MPTGASRAFACLLLVSALAAGCIGPLDDERAPGQRTQNTGGEMTAKETRADTATLCSDPLSLTDNERFCAKRVITITGTISNIDAMDVELATFNGALTASGEGGDEWSLVTTLEARGATEADARANLDRVAFTFAHLEGTTHFISAKAEKEGTNDRGYVSSMDLKAPKDVVYVAVFATSNGPVTVKGLKTDGLSAATSNGAVDVDGEVTQLSVGTSNGAITAKVTPWASGRIQLATANGAIDLKVPEDGAHGYDITGTTSNSEVDIQLRDGEKGACPQGSQYYTPPCAHRTFQTSGFGRRDVQTHATLTTSNGAVTVSPR